jgi:enoyl-CoA hydratase
LLISSTTKGPVRCLRLEHPPAHAFSRRLVADLRGALAELERDPPGALVLSASGGRFFSAGLDLVELCDLARPALEEFLAGFLAALLGLFRLPFPVVAAVNGHAIAGGAILALTADRRLLARGDHLFGLNEVQVGLPLPAPLFEIVLLACGRRRASEVLLEGRNLAVDEALAAGLVHEIVPPEALEKRAEDVAGKLASVPRSAYRRMKELLHAEAEARIAALAPRDPFLDIWFEPETRAALTAVRDRLTGRAR